MSFAVNHMVYEKVCEKIFAGPHLPVGGVPLKRLAHDIGTSIVPVREALIRLAQQDALDNIPSKGFFIRPYHAACDGEAFNIALALLGRQKPTVGDKVTDEIEATIAGSPLLSMHWHVFTEPTTPQQVTRPNPSQYADFDQRFLDLASRRMAQPDMDILRYIWGRTLHYRYGIYNHFSLYMGIRSSFQGRTNDDQIVSFLEDVFGRYESLSGSIARLVNKPHQGRSLDR